MCTAPWGTTRSAQLSSRNSLLGHPNQSRRRLGDNHNHQRHAGTDQVSLCCESKSVRRARAPGVSFLPVTLFLSLHSLVSCSESASIDGTEEQHTHTRARDTVSRGIGASDTIPLQVTDSCVTETLSVSLSLSARDSPRTCSHVRPGKRVGDKAGTTAAWVALAWLHRSNNTHTHTRDRAGDDSLGLTDRERETRPRVTSVDWPPIRPSSRTGFNSFTFPLSMRRGGEGGGNPTTNPTRAELSCYYCRH